MNLLNDSWIPVLREDGSSDTISPLDLLDDSKENPVVEIHTVRPDFDSAVLQFLIGLYQVLLSPEDEDDWRDLLDEPPTRSDLSSKIDVLSSAFSFDDGEFRFMQDASVKDTDTWEIQKLLLDIDNTLFLKEGQIEHLCPRCAAMALLTLQLNAPSGGRGHRTSRTQMPDTSILQKQRVINIKKKFLNLPGISILHTRILHKPELTLVKRESRKHKLNL